MSFFGVSKGWSPDDDDDDGGGYWVSKRFVI